MKIANRGNWISIPKNLDKFWREIDIRLINEQHYLDQVYTKEIKHNNTLFFSESDVFHINYTLSGSHVDLCIDNFIKLLYLNQKLSKSLKENISDALKGILANALLSYHKFGGSGFVRIKSGNDEYNKNRYNPLMTKKSTLDVLDKLTKVGLIENYSDKFLERRYKNKVKKYSLRYRFKWEIFTKFIEYEIGYKDLYRVSDFVMLKGPKIKSSIKETFKNYKDTDKTKKMRKDLEKYNDLLRRNHMNISGNLIDQEGKDFQFQNYGKRFYYRVFTKNNFSCGGRFYGHWVLEIPALARQFLNMNGRPTRQIDYSACLLHIMYSTLNIVQHTGKDLYAMVDEDRSWVKAFCIIAPNTIKLRDACEQTVQELGLKWNKKNEKRVYKLANLISKAHSEIYNAYFFKGNVNGQKFINHESNIANEIIMHFVNKEILILSVNDGFIIENRYKRELVQIMEDKWVKHWKARGLNSSKPLIRETKHLTAYNSPIEDIFDKYVPL